MRTYSSPPGSPLSSISLSSLASDVTDPPPPAAYLDELLDENLGCLTGEQKLDRILENQNVLFKLVSDLLRETRERKCCCDRDRVPKPSLGRENSLNSGSGFSDNLGRVSAFSFSSMGGDSGRDGLSTIGVGDIRESRVGPVSSDWDIGETRAGSADSNNSGLGDGFDMEDLTGEAGDGLLREAVKIKSKSCSVGNFAGKLLQVIFQPGELEGRNCSGTRGKRSLDQGKLDIIKKYVFKLYPCGQALEDAQWRRCVIAIDEVLRRGKKGARQQ